MGLCVRTVATASRIDFSSFELQVLEQAHLSAGITREHHRHRHNVCSCLDDDDQRA
jgi:hypothetical protein